MEKLDCPHLLRDFGNYPEQGSSTELGKVDGVSGYDVVAKFFFIK